MSSPKIAFAHYGSEKDIGGVTTWLERLLVRFEGNNYRPVVLLHHIGPDVEKATILKPLRNAGIEVEIRRRGRTIDEDVTDTLAFLNRHRPTVFLPQCASAPHLAAAIAGKVGLPWIMTIHSDDPEYWAIAETVRPEKSGGVIVGVSEHISEIATKCGLATRPRTIPYGVAKCPMPAEYSRSRFRVVYTGRVIEYQKRISLVVDTMILACQRDRRIEGLIVGDGPAQDLCVRKVAKAGLSDRIILCGRRRPDEVSKELQRCQAFLMMSDFEGLPISVLEAMATGVVPVVRSIKSGIPQLVRQDETGLIVNENPETAATAILRLASDPALWHGCSRNAKQLVDSRFNESRCHELWMSLVEELRHSSRASYPFTLSSTFESNSLPPLLTNRYPRHRTLGDKVRRRLSAAIRTGRAIINVR